VRAIVARKVRIGDLASRQPYEYVALVLLAAPPDQFGVWIVGRPRPSPLATSDR
jgi:hypothetical protein